ncbi:MULTISPECIES: hypothetical protein [unclassified Streptomyces]|uniref:hypothetical protein n=2 Tax=Streptomyces TaxID=1883 RepID=UPI00324AC8F8|nr:hypothetical protein OG221_14360 [Streptomyces sp. NBC_00932]
MALVQMQPRPASAATVYGTVADATDTAGSQAGDDMTIEVSLPVMVSARAGHLLVCDHDDLCAQQATQAQLAAVRDSSADTDRAQLRDMLGHRGPFTSPVTTIAEEARQAVRGRRPAALPVVDGQGSAPGVLALAR